MQLKITLGLGLVKVVPAKSASAVMDSFDFFVSSTTPSAPVLSCTSTGTDIPSQVDIASTRRGHI
jgi:hypothetical protein